ncbi:MAG: proline--tRNA ligase [Rhodospirillales bacterium]|nr:proline--tRNA ligase [Rhodospirillales bacterium]MCB9995605.1 proline--tRNA ligase [Rhodospirillales bacterium]
MNAQAQMNQQGKKPKTAITPTREENFPEWYQQVIKAADLAENAPVRGCMVIKPYGFALWENVQRALDDMIKEEDVQNAYFPLLIPLSFISREAEHVDGFAKECAVVTHHRLEKGPEGGLVPAAGAQLEEPFIIRPTSETIIGDSMAKWVQSYRDLPLKLNQWCNVMRWELRTRMFLRTSEFLWQEGHNAFATPEEANEDARKMLEVYQKLYRDWMAMPGIPGEKTADERFPGADHSYTYESMMQDGKALQACTSHNLGQNFSKSFGIQYQGEDGQTHHAYTTSWGLSTRSIGGLIMTHSDDDGLIMPPKVAPHQVAIIPVLRDDSGKATVIEFCRKLKESLKEKGVRAFLDESDARTPDKMWGSIKKGIPVRVEVGAREVEEGTVTWVRRDIGRDSKTSGTVDAFINEVPNLLAQVHQALYERAETFTRENVTDVSGLDEIKQFYAAGGFGFVRADKAVLDDPGLEAVQKEFSITSRCLPFEDDGQKVIIGKSY